MGRNSFDHERVTGILSIMQGKGRLGCVSGRAGVSIPAAVPAHAWPGRGMR